MTDSLLNILKFALLGIDAKGLWVADLGSTNGTKVNGTRIIGEQRLNEGDTISFGGTHIRFEAS